MYTMATNGIANGVDKTSPGPLDWSVFKNVINGELVSTPKTRHSINPATGEPGPEVPVATLEDVDRAMTAAKTAFEKWAEVPYAERQKAITAFTEALEQQKEGFIKMLTAEQGKPVSHSFRRVASASG